MPTKLKTKLYNFLRWSERYTKTDMVYLASGGFWLALSKIIATATSFILAVAYANLLPQDIYGTYKYVLSLAGIASIAALPGLNTALISAVAKGYEGTIKPIIKEKIKWSLLGSLIATIGSLYYFINDNQTLGWGLLLVAIFTPLTHGLIVYGFYLQGKKQFKTISYYNSLHNIIVTLFIIITIYFTKNIILIILINFSISFLIKAYFNAKTLKQQKNTPIDKSSINFGKHLSLMNIIDTIAKQLDKILIWHFLGAAELAIYSFAVLPVEQIKNLAKTIVPLALPKFSQANKHDLQKNLPPKIIKATIITIPAVILYILLAPLLYRLFFPSYQTAVWYSQLFSLVILLIPTNLTATALIAKFEQKKLYIIKIISPLIKIASLAIFIPLAGIKGAVMALIFSALVNNSLSYYLFKK